MHKLFWLLAAALLTCANFGAYAEEGGSGHYFPGSMASFMDGVSATPALIFRVNVLAYDGNVGGDVSVPVAGLAALNLDVKSTALGLTGFWRPNFESGEQAHLEGTLAQHFPLWGGGASAGVTGFWYKQITGDSGSGATFGDFKAKSLGIGPVVSYSRELSNSDLIAEFKWLHESGVEKRPEGDTLFLKVMVKY